MYHMEEKHSLNLSFCPVLPVNILGAANVNQKDAKTFGHFDCTLHHCHTDSIHEPQQSVLLATVYAYANFELVML